MAHRYAAMVCTAVDRLPDGRRCGYWLPELAYPWRALTAAGWEVVSISTVAGPPPIGGADRTDRHQREFLDDGVARRALAETRRVDGYEPADFGVVVFAGGAGAVIDVPADATLAHFTRAVLDRGGLVAASGYGVAGLLGMAALDDAFLTGRRLTLPSPVEERLQAMVGILPLRLADELTERGATVQYSTAFRSHVVVDGAVYTGQNPASAPELSRRLVSATTGPSSAGGTAGR